MRGSWLAVVVAGCAPGGGALEIEVVTGDVLADKIELFVGVYDPELMQLGPDGYISPLATQRWQRDRDVRFDVQTIDPTTPNQKVLYVYRNGGGDDDVEALVAVASRDGIPVAAGALLEQLAIPHEATIHRYSIALTTSFVDPRATRDGFGVQLWGPPADGAACVRVTNTENYADAMITLDNDLDCDSYPDDDPTTECVANVFKSRLPVVRDRLRCVKPAQVSTENGITVNVCTLGGGACIDGPGLQPAGCEPTGWCAPSGLCSQCGAGSDFTCGGNYDAAIKSASVTHVECPLYFSFVANEPQLCPTTNVDLGFPTAFGMSLSCATTPKLHDPKQAGWVEELSYNNGATKIKVSVLDAATCTFRINSFGVPLRDSFGSVRNSGALLTVALAPPSQLGRGVALPVVFKPIPVTTPGCPARAECTPFNVTSDGIHTCLGALPDPGTEVAD